MPFSSIWWKEEEEIQMERKRNKKWTQGSKVERLAHPANTENKPPLPQ